MLSPADEDVDVEVSRDDQQRINEFGRLNSRKHEIRDEIRDAKSRLEEIEDADEGILLADDDPGVIKVMIGEAFVDVSKEYAEEFMEKSKQQEKNTIDALEVEIRQIEARQADLKKLLYAKFGKGINLEE